MPDVSPDESSPDRDSPPDPAPAESGIEQPHARDRSAGLTLVETELERAMVGVLRSHTHHSSDSPIDQAIAGRLTTDHVTQLIDLGKQTLANRHAEATAKQKGHLIALIVLVLALLAFVFCFGWVAFSYQKSEVLLPIVTGLGGVVFGGLGGYGYGRTEARDRKSGH